MTLALNTIHVGDCRELLAQLPDESVNCVVTSPPYWGLRDYGLPPTVWGGDPSHSHEWGEGLRLHKGGPHGEGVMLAGGRSVVEAQASTKDINAGSFCACGAWRGQLGLEPTPELFTAHMVEVFEAVRRVLRSDGVLWMNLGDCYATGAGAVGDRPGGGSQGDRWAGKTRADRDGTHAGKHTGISAMGPMTQPNRLPIPGLKPKDLVGAPWRVAFALQAAGWWLRSDVIWAKPNPMPESVTDRPTKAHEYLFLLTKSERYFYDHEAIKEPVTGGSHPRGEGIGPKTVAGKNETTGDRRKEGFNQRWADRERSERMGRGAGWRSKNNVSYQTAVTELVESRNKRTVWTIATEPFTGAHFATFPEALVTPCILAGCPGGGVVLDPFGGSGTVARVAEDLGRRWVLFDLNPEYAAMARRRTAQQGLLARAHATASAAAPIHDLAAAGPSAESGGSGVPVATGDTARTAWTAAAAPSPDLAATPVPPAQETEVAGDGSRTAGVHLPGPTGAGVAADSLTPAAAAPKRLRVFLVGTDGSERPVDISEVACG